MWPFKKPVNWKIPFDRGMQLGGAGDLARAAECFREAARLAPDEPYPHYELGYTLFLLGQAREALPELQKTDQLSPGFFLVQTEIYLCEELLAGRLDTQSYADLRALQGLTDGGQSKEAEAIALSHRVIEAAPVCALGHYHLGKALFESQPEAARVALQNSLDSGADETTAIDSETHLGLLERNAGDSAAARHRWQGLLLRFPRNPHVKIVELLLQQTPDAP